MRINRVPLYSVILCALLIVAACDQTQTADEPTAEPSAPHVAASDPVAAGRYIIQIGGCNDCHTENFIFAEGNVPESEWLMGMIIGFKGPWGVSYASNLRLYVDTITEDAFVTLMKTRNSLPPMAWPSLHAMDERDLRAVYAYIKSLGPEKGEPAPAALPPGVDPQTPFFPFVPYDVNGPIPMPAPDEGGEGGV